MYATLCIAPDVLVFIGDVLFVEHTPYKSFLY
jgi:hypothetical protein